MVRAGLPLARKRLADRDADADSSPIMIQPWLERGLLTHSWTSAMSIGSDQSYVPKVPTDFTAEEVAT